jgi:hypothetical protein
MNSPNMEQIPPRNAARYLALLRNYTKGGFGRPVHFAKGRRIVGIGLEMKFAQLRRWLRSLGQ